jgi:hypothetical protein
MLTIIVRVTARTTLALGSLALATMLALGACTSTAAPHSTPSVTAIDPGTLIGRTIAPAGTTWAGTDSAGDISVFLLQPDGTVKVTFGTNTFDEPGDTWTVSNGTLALHVYIDASNGYLDYSGQYDPATEAIAATGTATVSKKTVTVVLAQK